MKKKSSMILVAILFLAGFSLLVYPLVANQWNNYRQKQLMSDYDSDVAALEAKGAIDYDAEMKKAVQYNHDLLPSILPDAFANAEGEAEDAYFSCLNITGNGMMGTVEIPKINITLPIFHTTEEDVLQTAAGHLPGSSLPVGGESTHAVISAHRGLPSASLFTDLDKMEKGDHFLIHVLNETLCYEVDKISVVEPDDTKDLAVEKGKDLMTLLTCTPYGVNSHRMLVRGYRVPYEEAAVAGEKAPFSFHTNYLLWVLVGLAVTGIFIFILSRIEKKRRLASGRRPKKKVKKGSGKALQKKSPPKGGKRPPAAGSGKPPAKGAKRPSATGVKKQKDPSAEGAKKQTEPPTEGARKRTEPPAEGAKKQTEPPVEGMRKQTEPPAREAKKPQEVKQQKESSTEE